MYSYCWCFIRIYTLHMYIESLSVVIVFTYLCSCVYHCKQIHKQMHDLKGVCSPHLALIRYSPSWLVLVLSPFMSLTQFYPSFCPVFGSWRCGSYHRAGPRTIMNYWFRHWSQKKHVWMISRSPYLQIPNIFPSTRHFRWTLQLGRTFINSFANRRRWARGAGIPGDSGCKTW